jgi:hypothetical protein
VIRALRFVTLLLTALGLGPGLAHVLELPPKMSTTLATAAAAYQELRPRWEYGHAAAFATWLAGFSMLLHSVVREVPAER